MTSTPQRRRVPAMGTPMNRSATPMTHFDIGFPDEVAQTIRQMAIDSGLSVSAIVRELVKKGMEGHD
jgi:hypothetical protein